MIKKIFLFIICFVISCFCLFSAYKLFLESLFFTVDKVTYDPYYIISLLLGAGFSFSVLATVNIIFRIVLNKEIENGIINKTILSFGILFMLINGINYIVIINNEFIECPRNIGYRQNIMRDYVKEISQCEQF